MAVAVAVAVAVFVAAAVAGAVTLAIVVATALGIAAIANFAALHDVVHALDKNLGSLRCVL